MTDVEELQLKCTSYENILEGYRLACNPWMWMARIDTLMRVALADGEPVSVQKARDIFREL